MTNDFSAAKKGTAIDAWLARQAVRPLRRTPVTPNMITLLGMVVGLVSGYLFAQGDRTLDHWGGVAFVLAAWLDHADGEHARATGRTSRFGHYFDHFGAMTSYVAMFTGIGFGQRDALGAWGPGLGIVAGITVVLIFSVRMWEETRHGIAAVRLKVRAGVDMEDTLYIVGPIAWLGGLNPFLLAAGIGAPLFLVGTICIAVLRRPAPSKPGPDASDGQI